MGECDHLLTLSFVGDPGVGKSSLLLRYIDDFIPHCISQTTGVEPKIRIINLAGISVKLQLWDIFGFSGFLEYRKMDGIIFVYDCTNAKTFKKSDSWFAEIKKYARNAKMIFIGNKCDLSGQIEVSTSEAREQAENYDALFTETSAIESTNVECAIASIVYEILSSKCQTNKAANVQLYSQFEFLLD